MTMAIVAIAGMTATMIRNHMTHAMGWDSPQDLHIEVRNYSGARVQLVTSPITKNYRKLCWTIIMFAFVARLAIRKVKFQDHTQIISF